MRIDFASMAFGYSVRSGGNTPNWATALGQGKEHKINNSPEIDEMVKGIIYSAKSPERISTKVGKGGNVVFGNEDDTPIVLGAVFEKVFINDVPITNGKFSFNCKLPKNEVCRMYLDNREAVYFYTDGKPISADMEKLNVRSDKASQKFNDFLQLVERERLAELHETDIQKKAEINRQRGERLLKAVRENRDNILSAYALSQVYTEMSYEELKPYLSDDYAFSHHILLAPMREYVEGLEKRRPGTPYTNLELVDTKGRPHQLSEYIGKGYVVLHFWHGLGGYGYEIHPSMKTLYEAYHSRGVEFITLAFNFGVQGWREEVKQRQLPWPQFMPDPDTNPRNIVACPRNVEELGSVLKKLHHSQ